MIQMIETNLSMGRMGATLLLGLAVAWAKVGGDRFPKLNPETLNEPQRRAAAEILKPSVSGLGGPWKVMVRSPEMADRLTKLLDYPRFKTSLPPRLNEFAILITARNWSSQFERNVHGDLDAPEHRRGPADPRVTSPSAARRSMMGPTRAPFISMQDL